MAEKGQATEISAIDNELRQIYRLIQTKALVTQVIDGETIIINNHTILHLPMIYIPTSAGNTNNPAMNNAKQYLDDHVLKHFIRVYQVRNNDMAKQNSLGHTEAYIVTDDNIFVQQDMVEKGLAFVYPSPSHFEVADMLLRSEAKARDNKAGLWASDEWAILSDQQAKNIHDRFAIIEGRVDKVASRNNIIYLNFERDWRKDFTVGIASSLRRDFSKTDKSPMQLGGKAVRVRGWIRDYNGPYMEVFHPSQIELIDKTTAEIEGKDNSDSSEDNNAAWGLDSMLGNTIAPKAPFPANDDSSIAKPYATKPLKPIAPGRPLTEAPIKTKSPSIEPYEALEQLKTPSNDFMDRGLLDAPSALDETNGENKEK